MARHKEKDSDGASLRDKKAFAKYLSEDEELVLASGYGKNYIRHKFIYYIIWPGGILLAVGGAWAYYTQNNLGFGLLYGLVGATIVAFIQALLTYHSHRYLLTTRRVMIKYGFFNVKLTSALYDKITHIEVDQSFMDRIIMKHGNVIVNTAGASNDQLVLAFIDEPLTFKNLLERLINREREQYGRPTGPVVTVEGELVDD